ncbi:hypothetical protein D9757_000157 [Collybiopsis confluens]|uniref:DUF7923 domain-containing protein n=1 Tax=Collybiopsis confluens TaxID=2823264 RepID=A0A8H5I2D3_9AGAR|nr:hypothetical protein D9757_000157 [Collybiopsis confluens]
MRSSYVLKEPTFFQYLQTRPIMTAQFAGMVNRQLWDETLRTLSGADFEFISIGPLTLATGLSDSTIKLSVELEARVAELEVELAVWKQAHSVAIEASERETKAHNVHIASLNKQLSDTDGFRGFLGGQNAAHHLTKLISEHLSHEGVLTVFRGLSFWVTLYFNKAELVSTIVNRGVCSPSSWMDSLRQASPRFTTIDVGIGENGADNKIREYILTYTRFPEALRVFLGGWFKLVLQYLLALISLITKGCYESNPLYATAFNTLDSAQLLGKLVLLRGVSEESSDPMFTIPSLNVDDLFIQYHESSSHTPRQLTPLNVVSLETVSVSSNGGLISPQSPLPVRKIMRYVDPKYKLHPLATSIT